MIEIDKLIAAAMKARNKDELRAYKNLKAEFQKAQTAKNAKPMDDAQMLAITNKYCKTLTDAIAEFRNAGRDSLADEYNAELTVLSKLLPAQVTEEEVVEYVESDPYYFDNFWVTLEETYDGNDYTHMELQIPKKEMGNAIKYLKGVFPMADGKMLSNVVKKYIV